MTTAFSFFDASGHELGPEDRVGSFSRTVPGTILRLRADHHGSRELMVLHDGDSEPIAYSVSESGAVPGLFKLNLTTAERAL
jgi:hypothetical protein